MNGVRILGADPWYAWYWSSSDGQGNTSYAFWVKPEDIRALEKLWHILGIQG